jgi:hypothetical protein
VIGSPGSLRERARLDKEQRPLEDDTDADDTAQRDALAWLHGLIDGAQD